MKTGGELIADERHEQLFKHGHSVENDKNFFSEGQLKEAAVALVTHDNYVPDNWNVEQFNYMMRKPELQRLIIAGALIAAEIDRLQSLTPEANFFATEKTDNKFNPNKKTGEL